MTITPTPERLRMSARREAEQFKTAWLAYHTRWQLSAPCILTGRREYVSSPANRRAARGMTPDSQ